MFDQLKEKNCTIGLDNLYISTKFVRQAFVGKNSVMVHGVARKSGRGLPKVVVQEEIKNAKEQKRLEEQPRQLYLKEIQTAHSWWLSLCMIPSQCIFFPWQQPA
jgi:hypothetical protein